MNGQGYLNKNVPTEVRIAQLQAHQMARGQELREVAFVADLGGSSRFRRGSRGAGCSTGARSRRRALGSPVPFALLGLLLFLPAFIATLHAVQLPLACKRAEEQRHAFHELFPVL
jgi:hypothetical protein